MKKADAQQELHMALIVARDAAMALDKANKAVDKAKADVVMATEISMEDIVPGAVFTYNNEINNRLVHQRVVLLQGADTKWLIGGNIGSLPGSAFTIYSDEPRTKSELLDYLNNHFPVKVKGTWQF